MTVDDEVVLQGELATEHRREGQKRMEKAGLILAGMLECWRSRRSMLYGL